MRLVGFKKLQPDLPQEHFKPKQYFGNVFYFITPRFSFIFYYGEIYN